MIDSAPVSPGSVNPVIPGFHPDPSVCRVGADYYAACSSFEYFPGVPLFHSRDLVAWTQIGNALDRSSQLDLRTAHASGGVYAPTLRHHDGQFWLVTTSVSTPGHLIVRSPDPAGPWSDPVRVALPGIDPDLAWSADGRCWFTYSDEGRIQQARIDPGTGAVLDGSSPIFAGSGLAYPEAPHLYEAFGRWYLVLAEGGTERGHAVSVARGPAPWGPFEGYSGNPVLSHRSTTSPVQSTGHADLVQREDGQWFALLLATRPRGGTPAFHILGRETFLTPVDWTQDGWPIPRTVVLQGGGVGAPGAGDVGDVGGVGDVGDVRDAGDVGDVREVGGAVAAAVGALEQRELPGLRQFREFREREDFGGERLGPVWVSLRRPLTEVADLSCRPGWLTLTGTGQRLDEPLVTFIGVRQRHFRCTVRAEVDASVGVGGLVLRIDERHHYALEASAGRVRCVARIGPLTQEIGAVEVGMTGVVGAGGVDVAQDGGVGASGAVVLVIAAVPDRGGFTSPGSPPDVIRLGVERSGRFELLGELDGRYLSTEVAGGFTGRMVGMYAERGTVGFDWFEYVGGDADS